MDVHVLEVLLHSFHHTEHAMKPKRTLTLLSVLPLLSGLAGAQDCITINVGSGWILSTTSGPQFFSQSVYLTGSGTDFLSVSAFSGGSGGTGCANITQTDVQGQRLGAQPLSGSAGASSFTFASFVRTSGTGTASGTGACTPSGVLQQPPLQFLNMSLSAQIDFRVGILGGPATHTILASAVVTPPMTMGKLGVLNRLVLSNTGPIAPVLAPITGFFYSQTGDASGSCTLKKPSTVVANTSVAASATIDLF